MFLILITENFKLIVQSGSYESGEHSNLLSRGHLMWHADLTLSDTVWNFYNICGIDAWTGVPKTVAPKTVAARAIKAQGGGESVQTPLARRGFAGFTRYAGPSLVFQE